MPIAWLDQYLLGAREIPLGHCSPCCRIDLLGCCNLKIHLFALPASLRRGLLSNEGSLGWPLASAAAVPWSSLVTWPLWAASPPPRLAPGGGEVGNKYTSQVAAIEKPHLTKISLVRNVGKTVAYRCTAFSKVFITKVFLVSTSAACRHSLCPVSCTHPAAPLCCRSS